MGSLRILYNFLLRGENLITFGPKVVILSARNTNVYKIRKFRTVIFSVFYMCACEKNPEE